MAMGIAKTLIPYSALCKSSSVGKLLPDALYVHQSALSALAPTLQAVEAQARTAVPLAAQATLVKFSLSQPQVAYLFYP
jgi:hypothetical protein